MQVRFHGAIEGEVTGSMHELVDERLGVHILVDCGMRQGAGAEAYNLDEFPFDPGQVTHVLLTHAHLDHCGRLPLLVRAGYTGLVTCTEATERLARINLEAVARQSGLFTVEEVAAIQFDRWPGPFFSRAHPLAQDVRVTPIISSHILGACAYEVSWKTGEVWRSIKFSGDVGVNTDGDAPLPLSRPGQTPFVSANDPSHDTVVLESTYGAVPERDTSATRRRAFWRDVLQTAREQHGTVLIPCFAIQRTQDVLFDLHVVLNENDWVGEIPVLLDAPMASHVNEVFADSLGATEVVQRKNHSNKVRRLCKNDEELQRLGLDVEADFDVFVDMARVALGAVPEHDGTLERYFVATGRQWRSALVGTLPACGPRVVVAGSGMCNGGRIVGHLREHLGDEQTTVVLTGYAASRTPGAALQELIDLPLAERAKLADGLGFERDDVRRAAVRARILRAPGYSGHASQRGLVDWLFPEVRGRAKRLCVGGRVFLVHGATHAQAALREAILSKAGSLGVPAPDVSPVVAGTGWVPLDELPASDTDDAVLRRAIDDARANRQWALAAQLEALARSSAA